MVDTYHADKPEMIGWGYQFNSYCAEKGTMKFMGHSVICTKPLRVQQDVPKTVAKLRHWVKLKDTGSSRYIGVFIYWQMHTQLKPIHKPTPTRHVDHQSSTEDLWKISFLIDNINQLSEIPAQHRIKGRILYCMSVTVYGVLK